jgi:hypothetical protein
MGVGDISLILQDFDDSTTKGLIIDRKVKVELLARHSFNRWGQDNMYGFLKVFLAN